MAMNGRSKHLLSNAALPAACKRPRADTHHMPNYRMPTCVDAKARGKKRRPTTKGERNCGSFRDRTLTWFRLGEDLESETGAYETFSPPEARTLRTTKILIAVSTAAGLLISLAWIAS